MTINNIKSIGLWVIIGIRACLAWADLTSEERKYLVNKMEEMVYYISKII